jgi:purine nucleosidase
MSVKVLLDTDIGSDIDDAVCLAYLLANPECELMGITTVSGESEKRARIASALCKAAGKEIPIFPGAEKPLLVPPLQLEAKQASALNRWEHDRRFPKGHALGFLRETIYQHPGEIVLLTIGPLTNIALLFAMDPEIPSLLKGLVMMCGVFTNRLARVGPLEWNALLDPHATAIVYNHDVKSHRSVGLDVTCRVVMAAEEVKRRFQSPLLLPVLDFAQVWFEKADGIIFHDPLAGATLFDDQICQFKQATVRVELASEKLRGMTHWTSGNRLPESELAKHEIALDVDTDRFFNHYFSVF